MKKGLIFDIKRFALHDGPGIRSTVFLKGCPLRCQWCQNPEGQESTPEIMFWASRCIKECKECASICPMGAISKYGKLVKIDQSKCNFCGKCVESCVYDALDIIGREVTVRDVVEEMEKDKIFFDESDGGVTLSGGEPLIMSDFVKLILKEFKKRGIHTAVDTSGYVSFQELEKISQNTDLFLYDLKVMDDEKHKEYTGVSNVIILENLKKLAKIKKAITVRLPLIDGINDDEENIVQTAEYLLSLESIKSINLLAYHNGGREKRNRLQRRIPVLTFKKPPAERMKTIKNRLEDYGFTVKIGG